MTQEVISKHNKLNLERSVTMSSNNPNYLRRPSLALASGFTSYRSSHEEYVKNLSIFDIKGRGGFYFHPESRFKEIWSIVIIIFLLYVAFLMPYSLAFS